MGELRLDYGGVNGMRMKGMKKKSKMKKKTWAVANWAGTLQPSDLGFSAICTVATCTDNAVIAECENTLMERKTKCLNQGYFDGHVCCCTTHGLKTSLGCYEVKRDTDPAQ